MGVDIVNHELYLVCGALAWAFNMKKKINEDGREVEVKDLEYSSLLIAKPDWFPFDMTPRNEAKRQSVMEMYEDVRFAEGLVSEKLRDLYTL